MGKSATPHVKRLVLLGWILVAIFYFYLSRDYIRVSMNDKQFTDYLSYVVELAGDEHRPAKEIRALILVKADELGLPIRGDQISVLGSGQTLNVSVSYSVDIDVPVVERVLYKKTFMHTVPYHQH